jgi:ABC-2 type transport system ATP-binding protein
MIVAENITKSFEGFKALDNLSCIIPKGSIYGLVGSNGAGKSTFLRLITGIYSPDKGSGEISIDNEKVWENQKGKEKFVFLPDELYFLGQANLNRMARLYQGVYKNFSMEKFKHLTTLFKLDPEKNLNGFSKGMKRQGAIILALSCCTEYIFFDETFDGLDPVMRNLVKGLIHEDVETRGSTVVITSHSLKELEDTCNQLALLHQGGVVFESDVKNLKTHMFKIQVAYNYEYDKNLFAEIKTLNFVKKGRVSNFIVQGDREGIVAKLEEKNPLLIDILPLSLEEVFVHEMEALGYAFDVGGSVLGGSVLGGSMPGGSVLGGSVPGGSALGGSTLDGSKEVHHE